VTRRPHRRVQPAPPMLDPYGGPEADEDEERREREFWDEWTAYLTSKGWDIPVAEDPEDAL
jgi:hypothetical protein